MASALSQAAKIANKYKTPAGDKNTVPIKVYSGKELKARAEKKKIQVATLAQNIQSLRYNITRDLQSDDEKIFLTAAVILTMDKTGERVGNEDSANNGHRGVTGLLKSQVKVNGNAVNFKYTGKSAVKHDKTVTDEKLAKAIQKSKNISDSKYLFCTSEGFCIKADRVNRYLRDFDVTAKDVRGYSANRWLIDRLKSKEIQKEEKDRKKEFIRLAKEVAAKVGHSPSMLRKSYLIPELEPQYIEYGKIIDIKDMAEGGEMKKYESGGDVKEKSDSSLKSRLSKSNHKNKSDVFKKHSNANTFDDSESTTNHVTKTDSQASLFYHKKYKGMNPYLKHQEKILENGGVLENNLSDGSNTTFDTSNPDIKFEKGGGITFDNFHKDTDANFIHVPVGEYPKDNPDYISESGSEYWYKDSYVYRLSDHWGIFDGGCSWTLNGQKVEGKRLMGKARLSDFNKKYAQGGTVKKGFEIIHNSQTPAVPEIYDVKEYIAERRKEINRFVNFFKSLTYAVALSANQVAENGKRLKYRMFVADVDDWQNKIIVNPVIEQYIGVPQEQHERCLSWDNRIELVKRYPRIKVSYYTINGDKVNGEMLWGYKARVFQHETDHLNGIKRHFKESNLLDLLTYNEGGNIDESEKETYKKWKHLVNMSASELQRFYDSTDGEHAGLTPKKSHDLGIHNGRQSARWIVKMKHTPVSEWTPSMWEWCRRQISFISRMKGSKGKLFDENGRKTRKHTALLIWGHNPTK